MGGDDGQGIGDGERVLFAAFREGACSVSGFSLEKRFTGNG